MASRYLWALSFLAAVGCGKAVCEPTKRGGSTEACNSPPVASARVPATVARNAEVMLDASRSTDPDGDDLAFEWVFLSLPADSAAKFGDAKAAKTSFVADHLGRFVVSLVVSDGQVVSEAKIFTITVQNDPPVASISADYSLDVGQTAPLDGSASSDPNGDTLTYSWVLTTRPSGSNAQIADPTAQRTSFVADARGAFEASLVVSDGELQSQDTIRIVAGVAGSAPIADAGPDRTVTVGRPAMVDGRMSRDPDGDTLRYIWTLEMKPATSNVGVMPTGPNFTITPDREGTYVLQLIVSDGFYQSAPDTMTITAEPMAPRGSRLTQIIPGNVPAKAIAVGNREEIYRAVDTGIYVYENGVESLYMSETDVQRIRGTMFTSAYLFHDIDFGPDGALYILTEDDIITSTAAHSGRVLRTLNLIFPNFFGVVDNDNIGVIDRDGFWNFTSAGPTLIYPDTAVHGSTECATEDIAMQSSGVFLYQPGCNGSPIVRGNLSGSGVDVLYEDHFHADGGGMMDERVWNFLCSAADPYLGGFIVMTEVEGGAYSNMYHFNENSTLTNGVQKIIPSPTFEEAESMSMTTLLFRYCRMAVSAQTGTIYVSTMGELWKVE